MKLFVSWSKETSHAVALAIRDWLPFVVPSAEPWVSSEDISKGTRGRDAIVKELADTGQGIICLTRQNVREPWLNFEAGALSSHASDPRVRTVLFDLKPSDVVGPLSDFQHTDLNDEEDMLKLVRSVNEASDQKATERQLTTYFERFWPDLVASLGKIRTNVSRLPIGDDGAAPRQPPQLLEEVLERVRVMDRRQKDTMSRILSLDKQIALIGDSIGLRFDRRRGEYVAFSDLGVGQVVGENEVEFSFRFEKGRTRVIPRRELEHATFRPNYELAQEDYDQMLRVMSRDRVRNATDDGIPYDVVADNPPASGEPTYDNED